MKIALVHDYLTRFGGAERVLAALAEIWPDAPVFTSVFDESINIQQLTINNSDINTSFLQKLPLNTRRLKFAVPILPLVFESFDLSDFDVVISSGYFAKAVLTTPEQLHINYCHTPPRFLYGYATETRFRDGRFGRLVTTPIDHLLRIWDLYSAQRPDYIVANSKTVAARVKKFWRRESTVIYPPVEMPRRRDTEISRYQGGITDYGLRITNNDYFLIVSRLEPYKNINLAVEACNKLGLPLRVVGEGSERKNLEKLAGETVEILGRVSDEDLVKLYANCRAFISTAQDEDFGIVPVEAMGYGKPVIALWSGGYREMVIDPSMGLGQPATGLFFDKPTVESLSRALQRFEAFFYRPEDCFAQAQKFSKGRFQEEFKEFVEEKCRTRNEISAS